MTLVLIKFILATAVPGYIGSKSGVELDRAEERAVTDVIRVELRDKVVARVSSMPLFGTKFDFTDLLV